MCLGLTGFAVVLKKNSVVLNMFVQLFIQHANVQDKIRFYAFKLDIKDMLCVKPCLAVWNKSFPSTQKQN